MKRDIVWKQLAHSHIHCFREVQIHSWKKKFALGVHWHSELGYGNSRGLFLHRRGIIQSAVFDELAPFALGVSCTSGPHQGHGRVCAEPLVGAAAPNPHTGSSCCTAGPENSRLSFQQESGPAVKNKICFITAIINLKQQPIVLHL